MPNRGPQTLEYIHNLVSVVWKHFKQGSVWSTYMIIGYLIISCGLIDELYNHTYIHLNSKAYQLLWFIITAGHLPVMKPCMVTIQSNKVWAVNEALYEIYVEVEDYDRLCDSIDLHDNFDRIGLEEKVSQTLRSFFVCVLKPNFSN